MPAQEFGLLQQRLLLGQGKAISLQTLGTYFLLKLIEFGFGDNAFVFIAVQADAIIDFVIAKHAVVSWHYATAFSLQVSHCKFAPPRR
jgi:hypothetical protein